MVKLIQVVLKHLVVYIQLVMHVDMVHLDKVQLVVLLVAVDTMVVQELLMHMVLVPVVHHTFQDTQDVLL